MNRMRNSNFLISQELAALVLFSLVPEVMRNCGDGQQSQGQKAFREPDVTVLPGQIEVTTEPVLKSRSMEPALAVS